MNLTLKEAKKEIKNNQKIMKLIMGNYSIQIIKN